MARRIEFTAQYQHPVDKVHQVLTSEGYWQAFISLVGGKNAELTSFSGDASGATAAFKQFIARDGLPPVAQKVVKNDMVINRVYTIGPLNGTSSGSSDAKMQGRDKDGVFATFTLAPSATGTDAKYSVEARVGVPIVGGQLEKMLLQNMESLITQEAKWASDWITENA